MFPADLAVDLAENRHDPRDIFRRHSNTPITNGYRQAALRWKTRDPNLAVFGRKFHGIREQIDQNRPEAAIVCAYQGVTHIERHGHSDL
jgi:hypothetical protein